MLHRTQSRPRDSTWNRAATQSSSFPLAKRTGAALRGPGLQRLEAALRRFNDQTYCTFSAVSSITNEVCRELSSLPVNFTTTVLPMYAAMLLLCTV